MHAYSPLLQESDRNIDILTVIKVPRIKKKVRCVINRCVGVNVDAMITIPCGKGNAFLDEEAWKQYFWDFRLQAKGEGRGFSLKEYTRRKLQIRIQYKTGNLFPYHLAAPFDRTDGQNTVSNLTLCVWVVTGYLCVCVCVLLNVWSKPAAVYEVRKSMIWGVDFFLPTNPYQTVGLTDKTLCPRSGLFAQSS